VTLRFCSWVGGLRFAVQFVGVCLGVNRARERRATVSGGVVQVVAQSEADFLHIPVFAVCGAVPGASTEN